MYPFIKTALTVFRARNRSRLTLDGESLLHMRVGLSDVDTFGELNNARHLTVMELGRWDLAQRLDFMPLMRKNSWGFVIGGVSIRYRRRLPFLAKYQVSTQILCHDGRWFYFLQQTFRQNQICSSALVKAGVSSKSGLVDAPIVLGELNLPVEAPEVPAWVQAWIDAEGQRPWPSS